MIEFIILGVIGGYITGRLLHIWVMIKLDDRENKKYELVYNPKTFQHDWKKKAPITKIIRGNQE